MLMSTAADDAESKARVAAFLQSLQQLGWTDGRNVRLDKRWIVGSAGDISKSAAELIALAPDVILAHWQPGPWGRCCRRPAPCRSCSWLSSIPSAPAIVDSLARPGGNATGFTLFEYGLGGKWLELLKQIAPGVTRAAVLRDPAIASGIGQFAVIQSVAPSLRVEVSPLDVRDAGEIERAVAAFAPGSNGGLIMAASPSVVVHRDLIITLAARHHLPAVYPFRVFVTGGGLISYGPDLRRPVPARGRLRRSHSQGRKTDRSSGAGADRIRAGYQPQDREGARHHHPADAPRPRCWGDRMTDCPFLSQVLTAVIAPGGLRRRLASCPKMRGHRTKASDRGSCQGGPALTHYRPWTVLASQR